MIKNIVFPIFQTQEKTCEERDTSKTDYQYYVEGVLLMIIGTFGIIGNISAIVVFTRQSLQKSFYGLMLSLAVFDLIFIITVIFGFGIPSLSPEFKDTAIYQSTFFLTRTLANIAMMGSVYLTMAITIERYITVCHPFYRVSHSWPTKRLVLLLVAFATLYNIPTFFELEWIEKSELLKNGTNSTKYELENTALRDDETYIQIYKTWLPLMLRLFGPYGLLITLNALIVRELVRSSNHLPVIVISGPGLDHALNQRRKEIVLAKVSLAIVFVFILCHSLMWIFKFCELICPIKWYSEWKRPEWILITENFSHLALVFSSSVNFYIYLGKHWRTIFNIPESREQPQIELQES